MNSRKSQIDQHIQRKTREQVMEELKEEPKVYQEFKNLSLELQTEFLEFCMGVRGLKVTYDSVFKKIFNPEYRPERLEGFLSLCLKEKVKILRVIPNESERLTEEGSLLIMDILIQLESGSLVNVEIQRIGYLFPGERCACYSSDLLMRQYSQVREDKRKRRKKFSYKDIKEVYTIVLIQQSTAEFYEFSEEYLHYFEQRSNTGLELNMLQKYLLIPLDIFQENLQNKDRGPENLLEAWLTFIGSDRLEDIVRVIDMYPEFQELYREVFEFRNQKRELISMYSKALSILDANTVEYMVEEQKKEIRKLKRELRKERQDSAKKMKELEKEKEVSAERTKKLEYERELSAKKTKLLEEEVARLNGILKEKEKGTH